jgi:acetylornithine deacetylase
MAPRCSFEWEARSAPGESVAELSREFSAHADALESRLRLKAGECRIETKMLSDVPPFRPEPLGKALELVRLVTGERDTRVASFATEAGQFQEAGYSAVICGPGCIEQAHQPDEFISLEQLGRCKRAMVALIASLSAHGAE